MPSHWTPYVRVENVDVMAQRARTLGSQTIVPPLDVPGVARVALVMDSVGALLGLWRAAPRGGEVYHG